MPENGRPCIAFLVQTESSLRDFIAKVLHQHDALVFSASTAPAALHFLDNYRDEVHLVIVDRNLPGADGLEMACRIARQRPAARVVLVCEENGLGLPEEWKDRLLRVPVQADDLRREVERALSSAPCESARQPAHRA